MTWKIGDLISYEPSDEWPEAQVMRGSMGVVKELLPNYEFDGTVEDCLRVTWLHKPTDEHWHDMILTGTNCRKIAEVGSDG